jgi:hypothetical protein
MEGVNLIKTECKHIGKGHIVSGPSSPPSCNTPLPPYNYYKLMKNIFKNNNNNNRILCLRKQFLENSHPKQSPYWCLWEEQGQT